jgi:hypothetical protein
MLDLAPVIVQQRCCCSEEANMPMLQNTGGDI